MLRNPLIVSKPDKKNQLGLTPFETVAVWVIIGILLGIVHSCLTADQPWSPFDIGYSPF